MDQPGTKLPSTAGAETAPGEDTVTSRTAQPVEPPSRAVTGERAADVWTGQYPEAEARPAEAQHHAGAREAGDNLRIATGGTTCEGPVVDPRTGRDISTRTNP